MELIILLSGVRAMICSSRTSSVALALEVTRCTHLGLLIFMLDCGQGPNLLDEIVESGEIVLGQLELLPLAVAADERGRLVLELGDDGTKHVGVRRCLDVAHDVDLDAELFGNAHGIDGGVSMWVVEDGCHCAGAGHAFEVTT